VKYTEVLVSIYWNYYFAQNEELIKAKKFIYQWDHNIVNPWIKTLFMPTTRTILIAMTRVATS